jgi:peptidoglycan/LPS O-acetylase OafA/YrhL
VTVAHHPAQHKRFGTFGTFRFFLAYCVMAGHLGGYVLGSRMSVIMFFVLSGYVVSMALAGRYMNIKHGW